MVTQFNKQREAPIGNLALIRRWNRPWLICYNKGNESLMRQA
jgi:hypothetical protein